MLSNDVREGRSLSGIRRSLPPTGGEAFGGGLGGEDKAS